MSLFVLCLFCLLLNGTLGFVVFPASRFHLTSARNAVPQYQASNSFVLVRRDAPAGVNQQKSEIFVPKNENKDRKSVGVVVSVPSEVTILRSGDTVIVEDPWGIGPQDFVENGQHFSFNKIERIIAVVNKVNE